MNLDGWELFRVIGSHEVVFSEAQPEVHKAALMIVVKVLKKKRDVDQLRQLYDAIGREQFSVVLEHMADKDAAAFVKIFDAHNSARVSGTADWMRRHLIALACGEALPAEKLAKPLKATSSPRKKSVAGMTEESPWPSSMTTVAPRRRG